MSPTMAMGVIGVPLMLSTVHGLRGGGHRVMLHREPVSLRQLHLHRRAALPEGRRSGGLLGRPLIAVPLTSLTTTAAGARQVACASSAASPRRVEREGDQWVTSKDGGAEEPAKQGFWRWVPISASDWKKVLCELVSQAAFNYCSCSAVAAATLLGAGSGLVTTTLVMAAHMVLVPLLIFTFGPISGAHFNPVVTVTLIARRAMALSTGVAYVGAQLLGGIVGAAAAFYSLPASQQVAAYAGLAGVQLDHTVFQAFMGEVYASFLFIFFLSGVVLDKRGWGKMGPLAMGLIIPFLMWIEGPVSSMCINPARAFGPALITGVWDNHWIFWTAPFLGGVTAGLIYQHMFTEGALAEAGPPDGGGSTTA